MARWGSLLLVCSGCSPLIYLAAGGGPDEIRALSLGIAVRGSTALAHHDFDPRCAGDREARDMAYSLEVPQSGRYLVRASATYDVVVAIYEGETSIACNDDHEGSKTAQLMVDLARGRSYTVVLDGWAGAEGQYVLVVDARPRIEGPTMPAPPTGQDPPTEDSAELASRCDSAAALPVGESDGVFIPTDAHAVVSCGAGGRGPEAVYQLVLTAPSDLVVAVTSEVDAVVELRRGCTTDHEILACVDDAPDAQHTGLSATLEPGEYFLVVDSYSPDAGGPFHMEVSITPHQDPEQDPDPDPEEDMP